MMKNLARSLSLPVCAGLTAGLLSLAIPPMAGATPVQDGLVVKMDAASLMTLVEQPPEPQPLVTEWHDLSGQGNNAVRTGEDAPPTFAPGVTPAGGDAVRFDGSLLQSLRVAASEDFESGQFTAYAVFRSSSLDQGRLFNSAYEDVNPDPEVTSPSYMAWGAMTASNGRWRAQGRNATAGFVAAQMTDVVNTSDFFIGGGVWDAFSNDGEVTGIVVNAAKERSVGVNTGANGVPDRHVGTLIGAGSDNDVLNPASPFSGEIAELLIFDRVLTEQEQLAVEDYLHGRHLVSGGAGGNLSVTDGLILWLNASNLTLEEPEPLVPVTRVTEWTDQSGRFNNAGPSFGFSHQFPRLTTGATRMGGDVVSFNGETEYLEIQGGTTDFDGPGLTWYAVFRADALDGGRVLNSGYADLAPDLPEFVTNYAAWGSLTGNNGRFRVQGRTATNGFASVDIPQVVTTDSFVIGGGRWDSLAGELMAMTVDGSGIRNTQVAENVDGVPTLHVFTRIGAGSGTEKNTPNAYFSGDIAEILIYNRLLTEEEQLAVEAYLYDKHFGEVPESGYDAWVKEWFDEEDQQDPSISGPEANPAGDGISNRIKYALGIGPWSDGSGYLPVAAMVEDALTLTYRRLKDAPDLTYTVEVSPDLIDWDSGPEHVEEIDVVDLGEVEEVTVLAVNYPGAMPRGFMRLRIEPTAE